MDQRRPRRSRGGAQQVSRPSAEPRGAPLLLFPGAPGLRSALSRRAEATRQMCCARGRLAVLERGGAGVQVHQLPVGSDGTQKPKFIKLEKKMKIHSVDQGAEHMLILSSDGKPFTYNYSIEHERPQCILQEKCIIQITCGDYHSLALSKGGELFAWGQNSHGQLGIGRIFDSTSTPQIVKHLSGVPLAQISAGKAHSMALSISGNMYSWGRNDFGQLGLGHTDNEDFPSLIESLDSQKVEFLACGGSHTALLTKDGLLFTFGAGKYGQLGHNSTQNELKPCLVTKLVGNRVTQVACGRRHTLAYVSNLGKVFSFGSGKEGQLGNGGTHNQLIPLPIKLSSSEELKFESHTSKKELIIIAGGNQSILLWMNKENPYVNLRRKIPTLNEGTIKRWIAVVRTKQLQNTKREIKDIFSSPACLTGSFVRERITAEMKSVHLDLNKARNTFKELIQKEWITNMITTCLKDNLLKDLPFPSPHQEALEMFFLLPECPMMHDISNWKDLVVPFAEAICKMSDKSSEALEEYWASLQESAFTELVQMFKRAISAQLCNWNKSAEDNCHLKALLETLKRLHRVNNANCQLSENTFHINELSNSLDFFEERAIILLRDNNLILEENCRPIIFSEYPFIFNMVSKIKLWQADAMFKKEIDSIWQMTVSRNNEFSSSPVFLLQVRRSHLVEDALCQLSQAEVTDLRKALVIEFTEEIRSVGTGVKSEFFHCMFEEMTKAEYGMFVYPEEGSCMWFPVSPKFAKKSYFLFGILCGLSLYHFNVANIPFPLALFKKLLDQKPSLEDLKELSPGLGKSLQEVLNYEAEDTGEALHIYFSITTCLKDNLLKDLPFPSPHQEALEMFFLLPECPMMHDISNWKDLVVPFAEAICKMSDKSSEALEEYWASLQESAFTELVQMFKRAISAQLCNWNKSAEDNCHLKALLETLKRLHRVNNANCQLSENTFHINELSNSLDFFEERAIILLRDNNLILEENCRPIIFSEYPFIFNMVSKIKLWQADAMFKKEIDSIWQMTVSRNNEFSSSPVFLLQVRRSHLVEDALCQLSQAEVTDLRKALVIEFTEEIRSVGTGVKSEFFHCMFEEMTKAEYGMFVYPEEGSCMWFPVSPKFAKKSYFLFGILCGLSLYHFNVANIPFPLALFKKLLDQKPSLEDLKELSPGLGKSLQEVLNYEAEDTGEALHIYFSLCWDQNDAHLIPNGIDILVDQTNKKDYVSKCVDYIFNTSVKTVYEEFQRGFYQVCDKEILRLFHPKELMTAIVGNTDYDWKQFEKNSVYGQGYYKSHPTILMFWEAFHKFTLDEKRKFLFFLTGNDRQTARGLQEMGITFCCPETFSERDLPRSRVCHSILDLPKYSTMERLEEALQVAINNNRGFVSPAYLQ
ncbi:E3 ISG15--protein ligase HERC5 isoform 2-T2 [Molossus nigricans]